VTELVDAEVQFASTPAAILVNTFSCRRAGTHGSSPEKPRRLLDTSTHPCNKRLHLLDELYAE